MLASAEVTRPGPPVLQVADAVLDADPLRRVSPAFGLVCRGDGGEDRDLVPPPGRTWSEDRAGGLGAQALVPGVGVLEWRASRLLAGEPVRVTMYYEAFRSFGR